MIRRLAAALTVAASLLVAAPAHAATTAPPAEVAAFPVSQNLDLAGLTPSLAAQTLPTTYVVQRGDTLSRIAARFCGSSSAYRSIGAASGIGNFDLIYPGQRVTLDCTHAVRTLSTTRNKHANAVPTLHAQTASAAVSGSSSGAVAYAMRQIGKPYVWGATGPGGFDCSGLIVASYRSVGITLPHFTGDLLRRGTPVSRSNLRPGDLVFLSSSHVGLAIGGDQVVVAPQSGERVKVQKIYAYYAGRRP